MYFALGAIYVVLEIAFVVDVVRLLDPGLLELGDRLLGRGIDDGQGHRAASGATA